MRTPPQKPTIRRPTRGHADIGTSSCFGHERRHGRRKSPQRREAKGKPSDASISGTKRLKGP
ncbi:hypothetical protein BIFDEN_02283 [Bifidobacterium dentium ATCC 27678]|nr:hypothetical protein BIFDEN_02283 [Bifidobacterium dentium ATCC 27678]